MKLWSYICGIIICFPAFLLAQGTVFTYQGNLSDGAGPANGSYLLTFRLCDAATNGHQIGTNGPTSINITNGLFTATLDFGAAFTGTNYWLEIAVQKGAGPVVTLSPRQPITTVPYAQTAGSAAVLTGNINVTNIPDLSGTYTTRTNNLSDLSSPSTALSNLGLNTNIYSLVNDARGQTNTGKLSFNNTNNTIAASNFFLNTTNRSTGFGAGGLGTWRWNLGAWTSDDDPTFSMFLNLGHGSSFGNQSEFQWTFNQMYFGPASGKHVQFGLATDSGDTFYFNRVNHLGLSNGWSHILAFNFGYWPAGLGGSEQIGMWDFHTTNYDAATGWSYYRFLSSTNDASENGQFADGQHDTGLRLDSRGVGFAEFTGGTQQAVTNGAAGSNYVVDFDSQGIQLVTLSQACTFSLANITGKLTNMAERVELYLYPGPSSWPTTWPTNILWESESGITPAPTNTPGNTIAHITLTAVCGATTNILGNVRLTPYSLAYDSDASNFFTASGITDSTQKAALNQLVVDLKAHNLWSQLDCIYPMVGGTSNTCSWNLKAASKFRIAWSASGLTFASTGVTGDGTNGFGNTQFNPSTAPSPNYTLNSASFGVYTKTAAPGPLTPAWIGVVNSSFSTLRYNGGNVLAKGMNDATDLGGLPSAAGLIVSTRTGASARALYVNGSSNGGPDAPTAIPTANFYICAENNGGLWLPSNADIRFAFIGGGLSASDESQLKTDINNFEAMLGRQ